MKFTSTTLFIMLNYICLGQMNILPCNNWLSTPSQPSYVSIGDIDITGNQITVEANFNRTVPVIPATGFGFLVSKHSGPGNINYALWPNGCAITTVNGDHLISENCPAQPNKNYHVAMVYDGTTLKYYRNGYLHSQIDVNGNLINNDFLTTIAQNPIVGTTPIFPFLGFINEVRIWNVARTQAQIQANMNASLASPPTQTGLVAYYIFDALLNKQGNPAWDGTLNGSATINSMNTSCNFVADTCPIVA
ncbi:MAG: LamG domain-containing protein, partial [Chitinophagaceae bacterium]|nr:LamG domain-containing protein [Chitinophagaceae bacterium]